MASKFQRTRKKHRRRKKKKKYRKTQIKKYIEKTLRYLKTKNQFIELIAEPKIDGLSISLKYKKGKFISGATRGDGQVGEDVTLSLRTINDIPKEISQLQNIEIFEVRGEIYMNKDNFLNLNNKRKKNNESLFANQRNAASGSLRQLDKKIVKERKLKFFAYTYGELSKKILFKSQSEFLDKIRNYGFPTNNNFKICRNFEDVELFYNKIEKIRGNLRYDIACTLKFNCITNSNIFSINFILIMKRYS